MSHGPLETRSRQVWPPSIVDTRAPASIETHSRSGSSGWHAIQRTWCVSGLGGKDHSDEDGSVSKPLVCSQEFPPSRDRHTSLGSVPAHTREDGVHRLRHTFCSHLAMRGAPARAIQELAGHRDLITTLRMHLSPAPVEGAIRLLDESEAESAFALTRFGETTFAGDLR